MHFLRYLYIFYFLSLCAYSEIEKEKFADYFDKSLSARGFSRDITQPVEERARELLHEIIFQELAINMPKNLAKKLKGSKKEYKKAIEDFIKTLTPEEKKQFSKEIKEKAILEEAGKKLFKEYYRELVTRCQENDEGCLPFLFLAEEEDWYKFFISNKNEWYGYINRSLEYIKSRCLNDKSGDHCFIGALYSAKQNKNHEYIAELLEKGCEYNNLESCVWSLQHYSSSSKEALRIADDYCINQDKFLFCEALVRCFSETSAGNEDRQYCAVIRKYPDQKKAIKYSKKATSLNPEFEVDLAVEFLFAKECEPALEILNKFCEEDRAYACARLSEVYEAPYRYGCEAYVEKDLLQAVYYEKKACNAGDELSCWLVERRNK